MARRPPLCQEVTLPDGTVVRVRGLRAEPTTEDLEAFQAMRDAVRRREESRCHHVGPHPMPEVAQRIHDRATYWCGLEAGHDGQHAWPAEDRGDGRQKVWDA